MRAGLSDDTRLADLGERQIVTELLAPRYSGNAYRFGDDCAQIPWPEAASTGYLVVTTDPCPPPMAMQLGFRDWYYRGWLLATINLSDIAAAGAKPLGLVTSLILPSDTVVGDFVRLHDGIDACCAEQGTAVVGGNLKEGVSIDLTATAFGLVPDGPPVSRVGARPGDIIVALGELGRFWAGVLALRGGVIAADEESPLLRPALVPRPQLEIGVAARRGNLLSACLDNSDGLYPSLAQLAASSDIGIELDTQTWRFSDDVQGIAAQLGIDVVRLALGWGDWQLIAATRPDQLSALQLLAEREGVELSVLGVAVSGAGVTIRHDGQDGQLVKLDSERFTTGSWFVAGLDGYIDAMLKTPIVEQTP